MSADLFVQMDRWSLRGERLASEYVRANPDDIGRAAERMGYVRLPDCEACEGFKFVCAIDCGDDPCTTEHWDEDTDEKIEPLPCPSCGGSGKGRLVNLTGINVEALREAVTLDIDDLLDHDWRKVEEMHRFARQVLAALDKRETP